MTRRNAVSQKIWLAVGIRTPFSKVDRPLGPFDAIALSVPVVRRIVDQLGAAVPDFAVWGSVVPNLMWEQHRARSADGC